MSLSARKVNMPGLSGGTFATNKKTSGTSSQATKNLTSSTSASKSTLFSLKNTRRTNFVAGEFTTKGKGVYNYSRVRANNNSRVYTARTAYTSGTNYTNYTSNNGSNSYATGLVIGQVLMQGISLLNQLGGTSSTTSVPKTQILNQNNNGTSNLGTITSDGAKSSISSMENATDSSTLRSAISDANAELKTMQNNTETIEEAGKKAQDNEKTLSDNVSKCNAAVDNAKSKVSENEQSVNGCKSKLSGLNSDYAQKCSDLDTAETNLQTANNTCTQKTKAFSEAQSSLETAQNNLDAIKRLPDSDPTKQSQLLVAQGKYDAAKEKFEQAKAAKETAEKDVVKAKDAKDVAEQAKTAAYNALTDGKEEVDKAEKQLTKSKEDLKQSQDDLKTKQDELEKAKEAYQKATDAINEWQAHAQDMSTLEAKISEQEKRLTKLEKDEQSEYNNLNKSIAKTDEQNAKLSSSIDGSDGYSKKEQKALNKIKSNNADNLARRTRAESLESKIVLTEMSQIVGSRGDDGNTYKTYTHTNGRTYYSKNNQLITQEEYNKAIGVST